MGFLLHVLQPGDLFVDVGANVGVYTILAAKNVGADVISIEPIPSTFQKLQRNVEVNGVSAKVESMCKGVGEKPGTLRFLATVDSMNHVLYPNDTAAESETVEVPVGTLDQFVGHRNPVMLKIDVEGYEWPVFNGAKSLLASPTLKALIVELNGTGTTFGYDDAQIHSLLVSYGFAPYSYEPFTRVLKQEPNYYGENNTIYLKDPAWASQRIKSAKRYSILNVKV
jgi:FkbM family methyltransferase